MDSSAPDSKIEILLTATTGEAAAAVKSAASDMTGAMRGLSAAAQDAGASGAKAMQKLGEEGKKAGAELERTGEKASLAASKIRMLAVGFGGMALSAAGSWLGAQGHDTAAAYLSGVGGGAMTGASMGFMAGGVPGAVVGGVAGAAFGGFGAYQGERARERAEEEARDRLADSLHEQLNLYEQNRQRVEAFARELSALTDVARPAAERTAALSRAIEERRRKDDELGNAQLEAARGADSKRFSDLSRERAANAAELSRLESAAEAAGRQAEELPERPRGGSRAFDPTMGESMLKKGIDLFGGGFTGAPDALQALQRQSLDIASQQLRELRKISASGAGSATWTA